MDTRKKVVVPPFAQKLRRGKQVAKVHALSLREAERRSNLNSSEIPSLLVGRQGYARNDIGSWLLFAYLVLFPFGQLGRFDLLMPGSRLTVHLIDFVVGLIFLLTIRTKKPAIFKYFRLFLFAAVFSLIFSLTIFPVGQVVLGSLYLIRIVMYSGLFLLVWNLVQRVYQLKEKLFNSLILITFIIAVLGWLQYAFMPDLRFLKVVGWDDHLFRLVGTFLDPTFTGIILVFGFLLTFTRGESLRRNTTPRVVGWLKSMILPIFFLFSIAFTYSRASYLALGVGVLVVLWLKKKLKFWSISLLVTCYLLLIFLPRPASEGAHLERLYSITSKFTDYRETLEIIKHSPVFGVGFNNMCLAKQRYLGITNSFSHSCPGADSSLLFLMATTGVVGLIFFINLVLKVINSIEKSHIGVAFLGCLVAVFVHSLFANSLFYPWVLGFLLILLGISLKGSSQEEVDGN